MRPPILFVAGLGRCGTTLAMTMLDAGGFPVTGPRPSYELPVRWRVARPDMDWLHAQGGRAVKWLDPMHSPTLLGRLVPRAVVILLTRRPREQARSQIKLIEHTTAIKVNPTGVNAMERSLRRDLPIMRANLRSGAAVVHEFRFEDVLAAPQAAASRLGEIVAEHFGALFDVGAAARVVIKRDPACAPHMNMETMVLPAIAAELAREPRP